MTSELVSVVIPVYNSEKYLEECLNSVLDQTYENIEIIVVDDGSTDSSPDILKKYSDSVIVLSQKNGGLASALNLGISKMKGHWFKWFSPDDIMFPNTLEQLVDAAKYFSDNVIVYSNWQIINKNGNILRDFSESNYNELPKFDFNVRLLSGQQINVNTSLIPFSLMKKGCDFRDLKEPVAIDYDFFLRAALLFDIKFYFIDKPLIGYRIHSNQLSHHNIKKTLSYLDELKQEILENLDEAKKSKLLSELQKFEKKQTLTKKTLSKGLKLTHFLPDWASDRILIFYLNKIRRTR